MKKIYFVVFELVDNQNILLKFPKLDVIGLHLLSFMGILTLYTRQIFIRHLILDTLSNWLTGWQKSIQSFYKQEFT